MNNPTEIQRILIAQYPGIKIESIAKESGQRSVFFAIFEDFERPTYEGTTSCKWSKWGSVAVKVSNGSETSEVSRIEKEVSVLKSLNSNFYPKHFHHETLTFNPEDETPLNPKLFVSIEERINATPLSEQMAIFDSEKAVSKLLIDLIQALSILWDHDNQYIHRDIKPDNILITPSGTPVVIDLGIIRETGSAGITGTHFQWGPCTPAYASPEQATNDKKNITFKSDLFSLGTLAYTLISRRNPFAPDTNMGLTEVLSNVCNLTPEPLSRQGLCTEKFSKIIEKLMEKQPYKRYRKTETLIQDLKGI